MAPHEFAIGSSYLVNSAGFGGRRDTMRSARVVGSVLDRCGDYIFPSVPPGFHDVRHRVVTSVLYDLPVGKGEMLNVGSSFLNQIAVGARSGAGRNAGNRSSSGFGVSGTDQFGWLGPDLHA